jgi:hypothetical protein
VANADPLQPPQAPPELDAANQESRAVAGELLPALKPSSDAGLPPSRLGTALFAAQERRGLGQLLEMAGYIGGQHEERERKLEAKIAELENELRTVRSDRDAANVRVAVAEGRQDERSRSSPIQPVLLLIASTCASIGIDALKSDHYGWAAALGALTLVCFLGSCWIAFKPQKR